MHAETEAPKGTTWTDEQTIYANNLEFAKPVRN